MTRLVAVITSALSIVLAGSPFVSLASAAPNRVHVVVLVVDGLDPEEVTPVTMPTLDALKSSGTWYQQARSVMVAETIPNHVAMMTGAYPKRNGIPVNKYWNRRTNGEVGADMKKPGLLEAKTLFTAIDRQCPGLRTASVLSKDYLFGIFRSGAGQSSADYHWDNRPFVIPGSGHAPDNVTVEEALGQINQEPDLLFVSLGDVDRSGHVDPTEPIVTNPALRTLVLQNTDLQVRRIVTKLQEQEMWEDTVMIVVSDHSMDYSTPESFISLDAVFSEDERVAGTYEVVQNGGIDNVYVKPRFAGDEKHRLLKRMRALALRTEGVKEAFYRRLNRVHRPGPTVPNGWRINHRRVGDLIATVEPGYRFSDPDSFSNPIPGNHGHGPTRHSVALVTGGSPLVRERDVAPSRPGKVNPANDTRVLKEQSEQVDVGVTAAWLLGIKDPGRSSARGPQFQGRVLSEAFTDRPRRACSKSSVSFNNTSTDVRYGTRNLPPLLFLAILLMLGAGVLFGNRYQRAATRTGTSTE